MKEVTRFLDSYLNFPEVPEKIKTDRASAWTFAEYWNFFMKKSIEAV